MFQQPEQRALSSGIDFSLARQLQGDFLVAHNAFAPTFYTLLVTQL